MRCRKWEAQILRWQEGKLDQGAEKRLLQHLESCVHCRTLADRFSELDDLFSKCRETFVAPFPYGKNRQRSVGRDSSGFHARNLFAVLWFLSFL